MHMLLNTGPGTGEWFDLPRGLYKVTVDIATTNAAVVTFEVKDSANGTPRPLKDSAGAAISIAQPGGEFTWFSTGQSVRAISTDGGTSLAVRASCISN